MNAISRTRIPSTRYTVGIGYVILPDGADRDKYITNCFRTNTVALLTNDREFIFEALIDKHSLQSLEFPSKAERDLGSAVVYVNEEVHNVVIIVGLLAKLDEITNLEENEFSLFRKGKHGLVEISGKGEQGNMFINVQSDLGDNGKLFINVNNKEKRAEFNLQVKGDINIINEGNINIKTTKSFSIRVSDVEENEKEMILQYKKGIGFLYADEFENEVIMLEGVVRIINGESKKMIEINRNGISIGSKGSSEEKAALGDTLVDILDQILTGLEQATTATSLGSMPLLNLATFTKIKTKIHKIKSKIVTLD